MLITLQVKLFGPSFGNTFPVQIFLSKCDTITDNFRHLLNSEWMGINRPTSASELKSSAEGSIQKSHHGCCYDGSFTLLFMLCLQTRWFVYIHIRKSEFYVCSWCVCFVCACVCLYVCVPSSSCQSDLLSQRVRSSPPNLPLMQPLPIILSFINCPPCTAPPLLQPFT